MLKVLITVDVLVLTAFMGSALAIPPGKTIEW